MYFIISKRKGRAGRMGVRAMHTKKLSLVLEHVGNTDHLFEWQKVLTMKQAREFLTNLRNKVAIAERILRRA